MATPYKYSDNRNSTYVNINSDKNSPSPVPNPRGNENRDESHRNMSDESFRPSFSNLQNTYMFSGNGHNARERFWGKQYSTDFSYRNSNADIEDPIFTGFTLSIDKLNSPLFYTIGQYDGVAAGRTKNDGTAAVRNIADEIENCLRNNYSTYVRGAANTYDIAAILVKEKYPGSDSEIGYGMQHNVYVDGLPYGATEYVYMVDKLAILDSSNGNIGSSYDQPGHFSLGDGTDNVSMQNIMTTEQIDQMESDKSVLTKNIDSLSDYLNDPTNIAESQQLEINRIQAQQNLDATKENVTNTNNEIKHLEASLKGTKGIDYETRIRTELQDKLRMMENYVTDLKPSGNQSTHTRQRYEEIVNSINNLDNDLRSMINTYHNHPENVQPLIDWVKEEYVKVKKCKISWTEVTDATGYTNLPIENETATFDGSEAYKKGQKYKSLTIKVELDIKTDELEAQLATAKSKLATYTAQEDTALKALNEAETAVAADPYKQKQLEYSDSVNDLADIDQTLELIRADEEISTNGSQQASPNAQLNTGDVTQGVVDDFTTQNDPNKTEIPKAPQTVYDMLGFIRGMTRLTEEYPYLLQTISGLDEVYKNNYGVKDSMRGSGDDRKITINIYESLDLKVSGMFNKYFNAAYDAQYRRERIPVNLRRFNCSVFVHDIRNFYRMSTALGNVIRNKSNASVPKIVEIALNTMSAVEFKFFGCEIVPEETGSIFESVTNADRGEMRMTNFTFTYSDVVINYLPFEDLKNNLLKSLSGGPHRPSVSVNKGTNTSLQKLRYTKGGKTYDMKASEFDNNKPGLKGLDNVYTDSRRNYEYDSNNIEYKGELEGLNSHDTKPQQNQPIPDTFKGKREYTLNSALGNVNKNDKAPSRSNTRIDAEQLSGIFTTTDDMGFVAEIGNVNDNDYLENTPVDDGSQNFETVRHGYYDRSPLGNVNNDDFDEFMNLQNKRDKGVAMKDRNMEIFSTMDALNSVNENMSESREEFDRLFNHLATSVAASIGKPRENVYDRYIDEIEHVVFPGFDTPVTSEITYNPSDDTPNTTIDLGTAGLHGINSTNVNGYVDELGNVNDNDNIEDVPSNNGVSVNVTGTYTMTSNGIITNLGDVIYDGVPGPIPTDLGDVLPDDPQTQPITNLSNVYPPDTTGPIPTDLGDVLPDDPQMPLVTNLNNVYPPDIVMPIQGDLGDVLPDDVPTPIITNIENVYPPEIQTPIQGDLGDVLPDDPHLPAIEDIGNVYPNIDTPETLGYIGDVLPDDNVGDNVNDLGNVYPVTGNQPVQHYIGDVLPDDEMGDNVEELGNIYPPNYDKIPITQNMGNIYPPEGDTENVDNIGDVTPDETPNDNIEVIGNIYPDEGYKENVTSLGDVMPDVIPNENTEVIGNIYPKETASLKVESLGNVMSPEIEKENIKVIDNIYPDMEEPNKTSYIGDVMPEDGKKDIVESIDNVYPKITPTGKVNAIGNIYPEPQPLERVNVIGDVISDEPQNETVKSIDNIYPEPEPTKNTKVIGDVMPDEKTGKNIEELGNIYPETKENDKQEYIDNIYTDVDKKPIVEYIDDIIPDEHLGDNTEKIGNVYPKDNGETKTVKELGVVDSKEITSRILKKLEKLSEKKSEKPTVRDLGDVNE